MRSLTLATLVCTASALVMALDLSSAHAQEATLSKLARPKNPEAKVHFTNGNRLYRIREFEKAIEEYKAAVLLEDLPIIAYNMAQSYRQLGKYEEAIWHYERFLGRVEPDPQMRVAIDGFLRQMKDELASRAKTMPPAEPAPATVAPPAAAAPPAPTPEPAPQRDTPRSSRALPILLVGVGTAALITGGVLFAVDEDASRLDATSGKIRNTAPLGIGLGVAGIAVAGVGGFLWWRSSTSHPTVAVAPASVVVGWSARF